MKTTKVAQCDVAECSFNERNKCHAMAVMVGSVNDHYCDTFINGGKKCGQPNTTAMVGACHNGSCRFNKGLLCNAAEIKVSHHSEHAVCMTYDMK